MLNVSEAVKQRYLSDEFNGDYLITIGSRTYTGRNVQQGSIEIMESLCSGDNFDLSAVEMSEIRFTLINFTENISDLQGKTLSMIQKVAGEDVPLGTEFTIVEAQYSGEYLVDVKAYDKLVAFNKEVTDWWNNTVTFPIIHRDLLISLCTYCGVPYDIPATYCNSTLSIIKAIDSDTITGLDVLGWLQEVAACFYRINRYGVLVPRTIFGSDPSNYDHEYTVPEIVSDMEISDYNTARIDKLQISGTIDDIGVIVGTGTNCYKIVSNALLFGLETATLETAATNIFSEITNIQYRPFTAKLKGLPYLETGDFIKITTLKGIEVCAPILKRTISGSGLAYDSMECRGTEKRLELTATNKDLKILKQRTHEIINTIDEMSSTVTSVEQRVTTNETNITQNANAITLQAQKTGYQNYIVNGDFSDLSDPAKGWELFTYDGPCEVVDDADFKSGKAIHFVQGTTSSSFARYELNFGEEVELYGKKVILYVDVKTISTSDPTNRMRLRIRGKSTDGTYSVLSDGWTAVQPGVRSCRLIYQPTSSRVVTALQFFPLFAFTGYEGEGYMSMVCAIIIDADEATPTWGFFTDLSKNNLISQINIAPEGIKIQGSKIDIYGLTTFHNSDGTGGTTINGATVTAGDMYWHKGTANEALLHGSTITYGSNTYEGVELTAKAINLYSPSGIIWMHTGNGGIVIDENQVLQVAAKMQYDNSSPSDVRSWSVTWRQVALSGGGWAWALCQKDYTHP